jgi:flagella basal body P-ring formation protein FlgA
MSGVALTDGAVGERIRVQNSSSKRIVEAIIVNDDTVKVSI